MVPITKRSLLHLIDDLEFFLERSASKEPKEAILFVKRVIDCRLHIDYLRERMEVINAHLISSRRREREKLHTMQRDAFRGQSHVQSPRAQGSEGTEGEDRTGVGRDGQGSGGCETSP